MIFGLAVFGFFVVKYLPQLESSPFLEFLFPECAFRQQTGFYCVGCGGTRAFFHLLHGRFVESLRCNWLCVPVLGTILYVISTPILRDTRFAIPPLRIAPRTGIIIVSILALHMILRNIPVYPLTLLVPPT